MTAYIPPSHTAEWDFLCLTTRRLCLFRSQCQNRQDHASVTVQGVDIIRFKFYPYGWVKILQRFDNRKAVNDISGKTGDGLCKNQVNLSRLTILDQLLHSFAVCQRSAADSFIIINANKLPAGLGLNRGVGFCGLKLFYNQLLCAFSCGIIVLPYAGFIRRTTHGN